MKINTLSSINIASLLENELFSGVSAEHLQNLNSKDYLEYKEGDIIFQSGEQSESIYLIINGEVKLKIQGGLSSPIIVKKKKNQFFGEKEIIENTPRKSSSVAETNCTLFVLKKNDINDLYESSAEFKRNLSGSKDNAGIRRKDILFSDKIEGLSDVPFFKNDKINFNTDDDNVIPPPDEIISPPELPIQPVNNEILIPPVAPLTDIEPDPFDYTKEINLTEEPDHFDYSKEINLTEETDKDTSVIPPDTEDEVSELPKLDFNSFPEAPEQDFNPITEKPEQSFNSFTDEPEKSFNPFDEVPEQSFNPFADDRVESFNPFADEPVESFNPFAEDSKQTHESFPEETEQKFDTHQDEPNQSTDNIPFETEISQELPPLENDIVFTTPEKQDDSIYNENHDSAFEAPAEKEHISLSSDDDTYLDILVAIEKITSSISFKDLFTNIPAAISELIKAGSTILYLADTEDKKLITFDAEESPAEKRIELEYTLPGKCYLSKEIIYDETNLFIPVENKKGEVISVIQLMNSFKGVFDSKDEQIIKAVIPFIADRIENSIQLKDEKDKSRLDSLVNVSQLLINDTKRPLLMIRHYVEYLKHKNVDDDSLKILDLIADQAGGVLELAQTVKEFSDNSLKLNLVECEVTLVLDEYLALLAEYTEFRRCKILRKYEGQGTALIDRRKLYQVIYQLVKNACDSMPQGGRIYFVVKRIDPDIIIEIRDEGTGIPEDVMHHIMRPFFSYGKKDAAGLGLNIADTILKKHKAELSFSSTLEEGSTFTISLPAADL